VEVPTDQRCKTAESQDGTTKTQFALEQLGKDLDITVLIEPQVKTPVDLLLNILNHKWEPFVEELMDRRCKTVEFQDGMTKTQSALEQLGKDQDTIVLIELKERMPVEHLYRSTLNITFQHAPIEIQLTVNQPVPNL